MFLCVNAPLPDPLTRITAKMTGMAAAGTTWITRRMTQATTAIHHEEKTSNHEDVMFLGCYKHIQMKFLRYDYITR